MQKFWIMIVTVLAFAAPVQAAEFTPEQEKALGEIIHAYIVSHPEVLIEAQQSLQTKQIKESSDAMMSYLKDNGDRVFKADHYYIGNSKGDVVFAEFFDYNCGYCKLAYPELIRAIKADPGIKIVLIDTPILGPSSELAARWALAAGQLGKYAEFHQQAMEFKGPKDEETLGTMVKRIGLDPAKVKEIAASPEIEQKLLANMKIFIEMRRNSTPTFFTRDRLLEGAITPEVLAQIAKEMRAKP